MGEKFNHALKNHKCGKDTSRFIVYTVYDNRTDFPVIIDGTADECAKAMSLTLSSFYTAVTRCGQGTNKHWEISKRYLDGKSVDELEDEEE